MKEDIAIDRESLFADVAGGVTLRALEGALVARGLALGLQSLEGCDDLTVADWLARGAPGAASSFLDPADHLVCGLELELASGETVVIAPSPRRATGPDLTALALGTGAVFGRVTRACLRVHLPSATRVAHALPRGRDLDPAPSADELRLVGAIAHELARRP